MGLLIGIIAAFVTKAVYFIEDGFEKLPVHWVLWPAIGGFAVGIVGYFVPHTLGVGYDNITALLSGNMPFKVVVFLCVFKFISWAIALGSGTSGGTLAPLLTIGGATGALLGMAALYIFPNSGVILPLAAMVGMSAMFAGASRALITSVIFALEASGRYNALLPLLCACTGSYFVSYFLMKNTIMTEKIARRGVSAPISFEADVLAKVFVKDMLAQEAVVISNENTIAEIKNWLAEEGKEVASHLIAVNHEGRFTGIVSIMELYMTKLDLNGPIEALVKRSNASVSASDTLQAAVGLMARKETDVLPVLDESNATITGIISYKEIIRVYQQSLNDHEHYKQNISIKRNSIKILLHGKMLATKFKSLQFN